MLNALAAIDFVSLGISTAKIIGLVFFTILPMVAYSVWAERRVSALIQDRIGPNRVGWAGLLQPIADGLKFILKEDFTPKHVHTGYYWLAPALTMVPALLTCAVLPFGSTLLGEKMVIADLDVGPLFVFAIASLSVYGIVLAGWASNSKYPFLGGVRSTSQMISYEISLGLSVIPLFMMYGHLNLGKIVQYQAENGWALLPLWGESLQNWNWLLVVPVGISFIVFITSMFAETNRLPFDLPECETELVAGYHTEYSSMKFALFFLGEYAAMIIGSGLAVTLFLGGWSLPFGWLTPEAGADIPVWQSLVHIAVFLGKVIFFILFFIVVRWTLPRFRYDQLMRLGWVFFFEIALANIIITALILWLITGPLQKDDAETPTAAPAAQVENVGRNGIPSAETRAAVDQPIAVVTEYHSVLQFASAIKQGLTDEPTLSDRKTSTFRIQAPSF